jgi:phenylalanyl-tRNA synthetase beta chain
MRVTSTWIKQWLRRTMLTDDQIVKALDRAGLEIEQVISSNEIDNRIIVCSVKNVVQHPEADRLKLADVETGEGTYRVVCGASNVRAGLKVPFAQIGAVLPNGEKIGRAKLRGQISEGMLCSEFELGLGTNHDGILELADDVKIGTPVRDLFPADTIIDLKTPANRFDVQSVRGIAREVSAMTNSPFHDTVPAPLTWESPKDVIATPIEAQLYQLVQVQIPDDAPPSPGWMQSRLRAAGMRPVRPLVDITNYVMLEYGQPLHAFDARKLQLPVTVRLATSGEKLRLLDGTELTLSPEDLVIVDASGPVALAGVMGGASTEVDESTTEVWLEVAVFDSSRVRKSAKRHGLRTEASARFERGLPMELTPLGAARAAELLQSEYGSTLKRAVSTKMSPSPPRRIVVEFGYISKMLGFDILPKEALDALKRLQIDIVQHTKTAVTIAVPWWRPDIQLPVDVVEEIVRVVGYDRVPSTIPSWRPQDMVFDRRRSRRRQVRDVLYGSGLFEVMTYSFVAHDQLKRLGLEPREHLKLKNPLSVEQAFLRSSLLASHLAIAERNRTYAKRFGMYEISHVFLKQADELPQEPLRLAAMVVDEAHSYRKLKGILDAVAHEVHVQLSYSPVALDVYAPGRLAEVRLDGRLLGVIGQLHPGVVQTYKIPGEAAAFEIDLEPLLAAAKPRQFRGLKRFPVIRRDVALLVPRAVTWQAIQEALTDFEVEHLGDYVGEDIPVGQRGSTIRIIVSEPNRTPTEAEAVELESRVLSILKRTLGVTPRV